MSWQHTCSAAERTQGGDLNVVKWEPGSGRLEEGGESLIEQWEGETESCLWVDVSAEDGDDQIAILERFGADDVVVEQAMAQRFPPKLESFGERAFLLLRAADAEATSIEFGTLQIAFLVGPRFLVTRHDRVSPSIAATRARLRDDADCRDVSPAGVAVQVSNRVVDRYVPIVLGLEARLEEMEEDMFEHPDDKILGELLSYKRQLKKVRRIASYHERIFDTLRREPGLFRGAEREIQEVLGQFARLVSLSTLYNDLANDLMNGYLSLSSHRLNNIMRVLTIITCIFVPLTFIAGIYGMNFQFMPELSSHYAYFFVLGTMVTLAVFLLFLFRRKRWL